MKKLVSILLCLCLLVSLASVVSAQSEAPSGDFSPEEDPTPFVITEEYLQQCAEKEAQVNALMKARGNPDGFFKTLPVTCFEQLNGDYCGPATVKQVVHYIKGSSQSQEYYASANCLGTAGARSTSFVKIAEVLPGLAGKLYNYVPIGSMGNWLSKIQYGMMADMPTVLDINTQGISAFPYGSPGHFVNTSGLDTKNTNTVRITDPYGPGLGNRWYSITDLYNANNNHWRQMMLY